jgi:hypothetical protein
MTFRSTTACWRSAMLLHDIYLKEGWAKKAWTWHEAADTRLFKPMPANSYEGDLVWIGNWGDDERTKELFEFLIQPVKELKLKAKFMGCVIPIMQKKRWPMPGSNTAAGCPTIKHLKCLQNTALRHMCPAGRTCAPCRVFLPSGRSKPWPAAFPCSIAPWNDAEHLFTPGHDFQFAQSGDEMKALMEKVLSDEALFPI